MWLERKVSILQNSYSYVHLDYASTQSSSYFLCGSCSIIMLYLNKFFASARIDLDNSTFVKLQASSSTMNEANEL